MVPVNDHDDDHGDDHDTTHNNDNKQLHKAILASRDMGKAGAWPNGQQQSDPPPDFWQQNDTDEKTQLEQKLKTKDAKIMGLETEMRPMRKEMDELHKVKTMQPTPARQNISIPPTPRRHGDNIAQHDTTQRYLL